VLWETNPNNSLRDRQQVLEGGEACKALLMTVQVSVRYLTSKKCSPMLNMCSTCTAKSAH
jgi:hypothetical protein